MSGDPTAAFLRRRLPAWRAFAREAQRHAAARSVPAGEILGFAGRYRAAAADLSAARALGVPAETLAELNRAVALAHGVVYRVPLPVERGARRSPLRVLADDFPAAVHRHAGLLALAATLFLVPAAFGAWMVRTDPTRLYAIFGDIGSMISPDSAGSVNPCPVSFSTHLWLHNTMVALTCFGSGFLLGIGTAWFMALNGLVMGALAGHFSNLGADAEFWPQVLPHGVTELFAILVSAQAGFLIARALWRPGPWSRRDALVLAGREAVPLLWGVLVLLLWSGGVEGGFTRVVSDNAARNSFAVVAAFALAAWMWRGRRAAATAAPTP